MYCRNCGAPLQPGTYVCTKCGVPAGVGNQFCPNCAAPTDVNAVMCVKCGVFFAPPQNFAPVGEEQKSKLVAALLAFFLGTLGIHNFYLGYTNRAVTQLLLTLLASAVTCGLSAIAVQIWAIVEGVQLLTGTINVDGKGCPLKKDI
jgi:TM2 domain-containing membrane protein YozV